MGEEGRITDQCGISFHSLHNYLAYPPIALIPWFPYFHSIQFPLFFPFPSPLCQPIVAGLELSQTHFSAGRTQLWQLWAQQSNAICEHRRSWEKTIDNILLLTIDLELESKLQQLFNTAKRGEIQFPSRGPSKFSHLCCSWNWLPGFPHYNCDYSSKELHWLQNSLEQIERITKVMK